MFTTMPKGTTKEATYAILLEHLDGLLVREDSLITSLSNLSAYLNYFLDDINWVGFYLYDGESLFLGPFQGLPACTRIAMGSGVCGTAASTRTPQVVADVDAFDGHIACDATSKSELVIPIVTKGGTLKGVLDIDSPTVGRFDAVDLSYLSQVVDKLIDIVF
jgi:GAF domain-containing protein